MFYPRSRDFCFGRYSRRLRAGRQGAAAGIFRTGRLNMVASAARVDLGRPPRSLETVVAFFQVLPECEPLARAVQRESGVRHAERKDVDMDGVLAVVQRRLGQSVDLVHRGVGHGDATARTASAMHQYVGAGAQERPVVSVGKAEVERAPPAAARMKLAPRHRIEALRRLPVALSELGTEHAGPPADRIGREQLEAFALAYPEFEL